MSLLAALISNPITVWHEAHYRMPIMRHKTIVGDSVIVNDPDSIRRVLVDNAANYRKDSVQRRVLGPGTISGTGLLLDEGKAWRRQRRALAGLFAPRAVESFLPAIEEKARALCSRWERKRDGRIIDVAAEMGIFTLEVLERTIFSDGIVESPRRFAQEMTRYFSIFGRADPFDLMGLPDWLPRFTRIGGEEPLRFFSEAMTRILARRRALPFDRRPHDILSLLLSARDPSTGEPLPETDIRANVITFIGAGHEPTANALTWTLYLLSKDKQARMHVEAEIDAIEDGRPLDAATLAGLVWTRAALDEAMRLYPPASMLSREAIGTDRLAGFVVQPGTRIIIAPWLLHRHRLLWDNAEYFDPRRFLPERRSAIHRFAYLPFGAGPRICIGMSFGLQEALATLVVLLRRFRLEHFRGHTIEPVQRPTLRPRGGMPMIIRHRNANL